MAHVLIIGGVPQSLTNFRGDLIRKIIISGHKVSAMSSKATPKEKINIKKLGVSFFPYLIQRNTINPIADLITIYNIFLSYKKLKPDIVLAYTIKPVIFSGLVSFWFKSIQFYALITGLGFSFQSNSFFRNLLKKIVTLLYFFSLKRAKIVFFQNNFNCIYMTSRNIIKKQKTYVLPGSGVNLKYFSFTPIKNGPITFLLMARLLKEKGIHEYVEAASVVLKRYPNTVFHLLGEIDNSHDRIPVSLIKDWENKGLIRYLGHAYDVRPYLKDCHVYVLPSYHEGMSRSIVEAMSIGRPILTSNIPGCREAVINNSNGFVLPIKNHIALAKKMLWFIENKDKLDLMGKTSRKIAEEKFDVNIINNRLIKIMQLG